MAKKVTDVRPEFEFQDFINEVVDALIFEDDVTELSKKSIKHRVSQTLKAFYDKNAHDLEERVDSLICLAIYKTYTEEAYWRQYSGCGKSINRYLNEAIQRVNQRLLAKETQYGIVYKLHKSDMAEMIFLRRLLSLAFVNGAEIDITEEKNRYVIKLNNIARLIDSTQPSIIY